MTVAGITVACIAIGLKGISSRKYCRHRGVANNTHRKAAPEMHSPFEQRRRLEKSNSTNGGISERSALAQISSSVGIRPAYKQNGAPLCGICCESENEWTFANVYCL
jgi:hypothetical protein